MTRIVFTLIYFVIIGLFAASLIRNVKAEEWMNTYYDEYEQLDRIEELEEKIEELEEELEEEEEEESC